MDTEESSSAAAKALGSRVSVACLPCRNRHVRCDAQQPICIRCSSEGRTCQYVKSRRGGLNRARLAERRRARDSNGNNSNASDGAITGSPSDTSAESRSPPTTAASGGAGTSSSSVRGRSYDYHAPAGSPTALPLGYGSASRATGTGTGPLEEPGQREGPDGALHTVTDVQFSSVTGDFLVKLFYKYFHNCHPCALPQRNLQQHYELSPGSETLTLLIAVIRFIGSLYCCPDLTPQLRDRVIEGFRAVERDHQAPDLFLAQSHLLYSIALYWSTEKTQARGEVDAAIRIAMSLGLNRRRCITEIGRGDPVLEESVRRTWWQIYCIDAYYAAIKRSPTFPLCEIDTDADLPCEEDEYESGSIPPPKTLDEFDSREFGPENQTFSSFAYLIGATRSIALVLSAGSPDASNWLSPKTIAEVDAIIDGWFLLLPKSKREVLKEGSVVDELMFQAQMAVHANLIALHRPFARLPFDPLEGISSCLVQPPTRLPVKDLETVHTQRCLQSIEAQLQLLVLPVKPIHRSPFTICMTAAGTHTLLAAIKVLFSGRQLAVARHQLRLVVGYIKTLSKVWSQGGRNLEEIQLIAQEVLSRKSTSSSPNHHQQRHQDRAISGSTDGDAAGQRTNIGPGPDTSAPCIEGLETWNNPGLTLDPPDSLSAYWNLSSDYQQDIPIWFSSY